ncbi:MAG: hypothetical protein COA96_01675 [SAR86 cluster bacterium]|uniref:Glycosyltransferase 2-like domain-containing protein n=1 Tax=SAR86 cluster bacterium TaxID=2030880 RepID=A0A2A5B9T0_9GAMM|nr:MAG: hypothetical protein COA96_01675 [SAR86 cluster bacterium]
MGTEPKIAILLSAYNGGRFLAEQLDSILNQTYKNSLIVVRDDGSSDETVALIQKYSEEYSDRFHFVVGEEKNRGASGSFSYLIEYVLANKEELGLNAAYMMFCDQDDIWFANKVEVQVAAMLKQEQENQQELPVLIHSDLQVVSEQNATIAESFIEYQGLEIERNRFSNMLISNLVTGCTAFINENLAKKAVPVPDSAIMHDWWMALVATAFGKLVYLDTPLVYYRQHDKNTIGAKEHVKPVYSRSQFVAKLLSRKASSHLQEVASQAKGFSMYYKQELKLRHKIFLNLAVRLKSDNAIIQRIIFRLLRVG